MHITEPAAHIDGLMRQTRMHHVHLSSMADLKANILITMASLVITASLRYVMDEHLRVAVGVLAGFCILTIVLAAYAVMPRVFLRKKKRRMVDPHSPTFNLLFFGDFVHLDYNEFESALEEVLNDPSRVYAAQAREIYLMGNFLARTKYRYVRMAYATFILGLISAGIIAFAEIAL